MTDVQAFVLALIILTIQTVTLIVFGFMFGMQGVVATFLLFSIFNLVLAGCADALNVVKEK
mgnify:CR=1 FL=1